MRNAKDLFICGLFITASTWGCALIWDMLKELKKEQSSYPRFADFAHSVQVCVAMVVVQSIFSRIFAPLARMLIQKKARWSHAVWGARFIVAVNLCSNACIMLQ